MLGGFYKPGEARIDLRKFCKLTGVTFRQERVIKISGDKRTLNTDQSETEFDYLIINTGVVSENPFGSHDHVFPVKPLSNLFRFEENLSKGLYRNIVIAGAGGAGTEIALNLSVRPTKPQINITVVEKSDSILNGFDPRLSAKLRSVLEQRDVRVLCGDEIKEVQENTIKTQNGNELPFDACLLATGNKAVTSGIDHDLPESEIGRILVNKNLETTPHSGIFAAGDTAEIRKLGLPQIGVHAVYQGKQLRKNLDRIFQGLEPEPYVPFKFTPLIFSTGSSQSSLAIPGYPFSVTNRFMTALKYTLDQEWVESCQVERSSHRNYMRLFLDGWRFMREIKTTKSAL